MLLSQTAVALYAGVIFLHLAIFAKALAAAGCEQSRQQAREARLSRQHCLTFTDKILYSRKFDGNYSQFRVNCS